MIIKAASLDFKFFDSLFRRENALKPKLIWLVKESWSFSDYGQPKW